MGSSGKFYARFTGKSPGTFLGGVSRKNRGDNWFEVITVSLPTQSGMAGRTSDNQPVRISKSVGSLVFARAQSIGELLPLVEIELTTQDPNGTERVVLCVKLTDVLIGAYQTRWDPTQMASVEVFDLSFKRIEINLMDRQSAMDMQILPT